MCQVFTYPDSLETNLNSICCVTLITDSNKSCGFTPWEAVNTRVKVEQQKCGTEGLCFCLHQKTMDSRPTEFAK